MSFGGRIPKEFAGLGAKQYGVLMDNGEEIKKNKGIKKTVVEKTIYFNDFKDCLFTGKPQMRLQNLIGSDLHDIFTKLLIKMHYQLMMIRGIFVKTG